MDLGEITLFHTESFMGEPQITRSLHWRWVTEIVRTQGMGTVGSLLGINSKQCKTGLGSFAGTFWPDVLFLAGHKSQQIVSQILLTAVHLGKLYTLLASEGRFLWGFLPPFQGEVIKALFVADLILFNCICR